MPTSSPTKYRNNSPSKKYHRRSRSIEAQLGSQLQRVTLSNDAKKTTADAAVAHKATENMNYQPMAKGVRSKLWLEGYEQRVHRKKNGFNHFKLEWSIPTDRGIGRRLKPPEVGLRKRYFSARSVATDPIHGPVPDLLESLNLQPTKLEEKRDKLQRLYSRVEKKKMETKLAEAKKREDSMGNMDSQGNLKVSQKLTDYEKNMLNARKPNIQLACSTVGSTSRSLPPSANLRGTN